MIHTEQSTISNDLLLDTIIMTPNINENDSNYTFFQNSIDYKPLYDYYQFIQPQLLQSKSLFDQIVLSTLPQSSLPISNQITQQQIPSTTTTTSTTIKPKRTQHYTFLYDILPPNNIGSSSLLSSSSLYSGTIILTSMSSDYGLYCIL